MNEQKTHKILHSLPFQLHQLPFSQPLVLRLQQNKWPFSLWKCHALLGLTASASVLPSSGMPSQQSLSLLQEAAPAPPPVGRLPHLPWGHLGTPASTQPAEVPSTQAMSQCRWKKPSRQEQMLERSNANLKNI